MYAPCTDKVIESIEIGGIVLKAEVSCLPARAKMGCFDLDVRASSNITGEIPWRRVAAFVGCREIYDRCRIGGTFPSSALRRVRNLQFFVTGITIR